MGWGSAPRPGHLYTQKKTRYLFYSRLGGPQGRSGEGEILVPTGIRSRTVQPVAQSLYRLSYRAHVHFCIPLYFWIEYWKIKILNLIIASIPWLQTTHNFYRNEIVFLGVFTNIWTVKTFQSMMDGANLLSTVHCSSYCSTLSPCILFWYLEEYL